MRDLLDADGENLALRTFLVQYGLPGLTVGAMRSHMSLSGWGEPYFPAFVLNAYSGEHLTKAGAQIWIRHLLALEAKPAATDEAWGVYVTQPDKQGWMRDSSGFPALWSEGKAKSFETIPGAEARKLRIVAYDITEDKP